MAESHKHKLLKQVGMRWAQSVGCVAFAFEVSYSFIGIVDVMGVKTNGDVYVIEAKISASDFRSDFKEKRYRMPKIERFEKSSKVDFVYYIVADGIDTGCLPAFIGILNEHGRVIRRAKRRDRVRTDKTKLDSFLLIAKALSWRKYGYVILHEQEQLEFSLM